MFIPAPFFDATEEQFVIEFELDSMIYIPSIKL